MLSILPYLQIRTTVARESRDAPTSDEGSWGIRYPKKHSAGRHASRGEGVGNLAPVALTHCVVALWMVWSWPCLMSWKERPHPQPTWQRQQRAFQHFRSSCNQERPYEALDQQPPARRYRPSVRPFPRRADSPEYQSGTTVRRVRTNGEIKWQGQMVYLSEALCGEPVGLTPQDERFWTVRFGPLQIWLLDRHANRTLLTPNLVLPMSPVYV